MSRSRKAPTDPHERLAEAIEGLTQRLTVVQDAMDDIRTELNYAVTNAKPIFVMPRVLPLDPTGPRWNERLDQLNSPDALLHRLLESAELSQDEIEPHTREIVEKLHAVLNAERSEEQIVCTECTATLPLAEAVRSGWQEVDSDGKDIFGVCPPCLQREDEAVEITPLISEPPLEKRIEDHEKWGREVRDPARESSEGVRELKVPGAEAYYEIGRTMSGKWAVSLHATYTKGDCSGSGMPWSEHETREECVVTFLAFARRHFSGANIYDNQKEAQKAMLKLLAGEGLFGFVEPEPFPRGKLQ